MEPPPKSKAASIVGTFSPLDFLLVAVPTALLIRWVPGWRNDTALFIIAGLGIIPLAGWMGKATEHISARTGPGIGGLLNATFGNAAELIIALMAVSKGLVGIVKASITGSIIGNLLLVLGASIFAGGLKFPKQTFNRTGARISATTLTLAVIGLIIPTVFHVAADRTPGGWSIAAEQNLSLAIAAILLATYVAWLIFSLGTHKKLFLGKSSDESPHAETWSTGRSVAVLGIATVLVGIMSELLVGSIEAARTTLGLSEVFVGVIIVATVGNAAEHSTAVLVALKNKMELSLAIANGSSLQIALFVTPVLVFASYFFGRPMDLEFTIPEISAVAIAVWISGQISGDGECNWLEGAQLLAVYLIIGVLFYFLPEHPAPETGSLTSPDKLNVSTHSRLSMPLSGQINGSR